MDFFRISTIIVAQNKCSVQINMEYLNEFSRVIFLLFSLLGDAACLGVWASHSGRDYIGHTVLSARQPRLSPQGVSSKYSDFFSSKR